MRSLEWVIRLLAASGYGGIAVIMCAADIVFVIPSEVITPLAGFVSVRYGLSYWGVVMAATAGSVVGGVPWYLVGRRLQRHGLDAWLAGRRSVMGISTRSIGKAERWFFRHGRLAVLMARLLPGIRPAIGIPAGAAGMPFTLFLVYSTLGTAIWTAGLVLAGRLLEEEFRRAEPVVLMGGIFIVSISAVGYSLWALVRPRRHPPPTSP